MNKLREGPFSPGFTLDNALALLSTTSDSALLIHAAGQFQRSISLMFGKNNKYFLVLLLWLISKSLTRVMGIVYSEFSFCFTSKKKKKSQPPSWESNSFQYKNDVVLFSGWIKQNKRLLKLSFPSLNSKCGRTQEGQGKWACSLFFFLIYK